MSLINKNIPLVFIGKFDDAKSEIEKHPQLPAMPRMVLIARAKINTKSSDVRIIAAPLQKIPKIKKSPAINSTQGRKTETKLINISGTSL